MRLSVFKEDTEALIAKKDGEMIIAANANEETIKGKDEEIEKKQIECSKLGKELAVATIDYKKLKEKIAVSIEEANNLKLELDDIKQQLEEEKKENAK